MTGVILSEGPLNDFNWKTKLWRQTKALCWDVTLWKIKGIMFGKLYGKTRDFVYVLNIEAHWAYLEYKIN